MNTEILLPDGTPVKLGCLQPEVMRFESAGSWADANDVLPEDQWEEHDDYAGFTPPIKSQKNNNCTNASWSELFSTLWESVGEPPVELSWSYLYALNNGGRDQGAMCRDIAADSLSRGNPLATLCPESQIFVPRGGWPKAVIDDARSRLALEIYQCMNWADVGSALTRRFLVYHGFVLGNAFFGTRSDGKVPSYDGRRSNGHAMWSRGLTRRFGDMRAIVPNTWGVSYGDQGIGYIDKSYFWAQSGGYFNLDAYAVRAVKKPG